MSWLTSDEGWRVITTAVIPFFAILIAGLLAAAIARGSSRRLLEFQDRELKAAAVLALIGAGRKATVWSSLGGDEKQRVDNQLSEADIRIRLLPVNGANAAGDWAAHELAAMKKNSASFSFQADQTFVDFRDRLLEWQNKPKRARKLFAYDLEQWRYEDEAVDKSLVQKQQEWAANQVDDTPLAASVASATAAAAATPATAPVAPAAEPTPTPPAAAAPVAIPMPAAAAEPVSPTVASPDYREPTPAAAPEVAFDDGYADTAVIEASPTQQSAPADEYVVEEHDAVDRLEADYAAEEPVTAPGTTDADSGSHNYDAPATAPRPQAYHPDDSETEPETSFLADEDDDVSEGDAVYAADGTVRTADNDDVTDDSIQRENNDWEHRPNQ